MVLFYGDVHYGVKISNKNMLNIPTIYGDNFDEDVIYEVKFTATSKTLQDYLIEIKTASHNCLEPTKYKYELLIEVVETPKSTNGEYKHFILWQIISPNQMIDFINGLYKIDFY